jgi:SAM-dependent methyltransferase
MRALDVADGAWAGIAAFYVIIHVPREEMVSAFCELRRVLRPGGTLLLAFHVGCETLHLDEWWERSVCLDFYFFRPDEVAGWLLEAGFEVAEVVERSPYPQVEYQSRRAYVFARKPAADGDSPPRARS